MVEIYGPRGSGAGQRGGVPGRSGGQIAGPGGFRPGGGRPIDPDAIASFAQALDASIDEVREAISLVPDFEAMASLLEVEIEALFEAMGLPPGFRPPVGGFPGADFGPRGYAIRSEQRTQLAERNPIWVPVTIQFVGETWREVGFRYKGNSSLAFGWHGGATALPFKLDFDEFEDEHPELDNQRFYGFKQLSFANGEFDPSLQREKVAADIFRDAGVPAAQTAFYAVYVDTGAGEGYQYWGVYTAVELPDDTLIETQFADDDGNMYKPEGAGASFAAGSFNEASFDKETNRDSDFDDVLAVFDALHAETRLSDPAAWRESLETVFDAEGFLQWLAANTLMQNWDTYGATPHNYYLYADAATGQLVWIPWDNTLALTATVVLGDPLSLELEEVEAERWPLIGFLMEDPVYRAAYHGWVEKISAEVFTPARMIPIYEANHNLLAAAIRSTEGDSAVEALRSATDALIDHVIERAAVAGAYLAKYGTN